MTCTRYKRERLPTYLCTDDKYHNGNEEDKSVISRDNLRCLVTNGAMGKFVKNKAKKMTFINMLYDDSLLDERDYLSGRNHDNMDIVLLKDGRLYTCYAGKSKHRPYPFNEEDILKRKAITMEASKKFQIVNILEELNAELGIPYQQQLAKNYARAVKAFENGEDKLALTSIYDKLFMATFIKYSEEVLNKQAEISKLNPVVINYTHKDTNG